MGNLVVTFLWDPIPSRDQQIIEELRLLAKKYSLSEAGPNIREYEEGKTIFGAENARFWRLVIADSKVDDFARGCQSYEQIQSRGRVLEDDQDVFVGVRVGLCFAQGAKVKGLEHV